MALFRRRARLPDEVRGRLSLQGRDRIVAVGELTDGWAVASLRDLHVLPTEGEVTSRSWSMVDGARLEAETATLSVTWVDGAPPTELPLADDRDPRLARAVHARVQWSVVHRESLTLPGGATVRVALRRGPDDELLTQVIGAGDVDLTDPATAAAVDAAETRVREAAGLR